MPQRFVRLELAEVDPGPAGDQRHGALVTDVGFVFLELGLGLGVGFAEDHGLQVENQDAVGIPARLGRAPTDIGHDLLQQHLGRRGDEHAFGMLGGELLAPARRTGLVEHRCTLRRRLAQVNAGHLEVFAQVLDLVDLARIAEQLALAIAQDRAVFPTAFPELVADLQVLFGVVITRVMFGLGALAEVLRPALQVGGDDIPAGTALGQVVEGRQATGERIRMLERQRSGQAEPQVLGHQRHRRDQLQRVVDRHLRRLADRRVTVAVVDVVDTQHIGNEQAVELAALEDFRQVGPVLQVLVLPGAIPWMGPQPRGLVPHAVHVEGIETDFTGHRQHSWNGQAPRR